MMYEKKNLKYNVNKMWLPRAFKGLRSLRIFKKSIFFSYISNLNKLNKSPPMRFLLQKKGHFMVLGLMTRCKL